jgi:hypothetical protein
MRQPISNGPPASEPANSRMTPQAGEVYQHYKGDHYMVLTFARHTQPAVWARPLEMFLAEVAVENPDPVTGVSAGVSVVERFRKIGR